MSGLRWLGNLEGTTDPWKVANDDELDADGMPRTYVLKHFRAWGIQGRLVEYVAGKIAEELEVGSPEVRLIEVTSGFLESLRYISGPGPSMLSDARPGLHVGVVYDEKAAPVTDARSVAGRLADPLQPAGIIAVDALVQNDDREPRNLLMRPESVGRYAKHRLVPIDWSHAFCNASHPTVLRGMSWDRGLKAHPPLTHLVRSREDFREIRSRIEKWGTDARVRALIRWIPGEWGVSTEWRRKLEKYILNRITTTLHDLDRPDDPDGLFPNWQYSVKI